jgi:hypothetical protein
MARAYLRDFIDSVSIYSPDVWRAILQMEEALQQSGGGYEQ